MTEVRVEREGFATTIVIDRPASQNAISRPVMDELARALDEVEGSDARVVVVRGAGERVFVSGGDLKELAAIRTIADAEAMARQMRELLDRVAHFPVPVVAALNGSAFGGGCEVAVACDFRIAPDDIRLAFNQVDLAIMPAWGGIERLRDLVGHGRAMYLATTGLPVAASIAWQWGLIEVVVPRAEFDERVSEVVARMAAIPRDALRGIKGVASRARGRVPDHDASAAITSFAATWVADAHWNAVETMAAKRLQVRYG